MDRQTDGRTAGDSIASRGENMVKAQNNRTQQGDPSKNTNIFKSKKTDKTEDRWELGLAAFEETHRAYCLKREGLAYKPTTFSTLVTLVRLSLVTNKGYLLTYLLTLAPRTTG